MNIILTIEGGTAAEVRQAIMDLSATYSVGAQGELQETDTRSSRAAAKKSEVKTQQTSPENKSEPQQQPTNSNGGSSLSGVTMEEIRKVMGEKSKAGKRQQMKDLLAEYGAADLTGLDAAHYGEIFEKVKAA